MAQVVRQACGSEGALWGEKSKVSAGCRRVGAGPVRREKEGADWAHRE